ncbi:MAG: cobalamin-dependent protein [Syntrophaceae bacterium]|nr:cobalamin-dependent protein [Syntrophaceae bacterium]
MRVAIIATPYPLEEIPAPPLGVAYVAAAFEAAGAEVKIFDYIVSNYTKEDLKRKLENFQPDAVGATSVTMNFYEGQRIIRDVKDCNPEIITMMGGPHVSFTASDALRQYPEIDLIVIGEGEVTIAELTPVIRHKNKWRDIRGIAYRNDDEIVLTGKRDFIADIDSIPLPARRLLPLSRYQALGYPVSMITSRGCPHSCIFCVGRRMVGAKIRKRKSNLVLDEIEEIIGYGFDRINVADDLFTFDKERVKEICAGIKERSLKFKWSAFARADTASQEVFDRMAEAGCDAVSFGVETGNPEILKQIKKGIKLEQVYTAVKMCQKAGMMAHTSFIVGLPGETKDTLMETEKFAKSTKAIYGYHILAPFPGTTVREKVQDYDLEILTDDWAKYDANDPIIKTSSLVPQDMRDFVARYDDEMKDETRKLLKGYYEGTNTIEDNMFVEGRWRMELTYKILKGDIIENSGFIEPALFEGSKNRALQELCRRVKESTKADTKVVDDTISDFAGRGYIRADISDKGCTWSWSV